MNYISTRGGCEPCGFTEAVMTGLAPDGGLFVPEKIPDLRGRLDALKEFSYRELAFEIIREYADVPYDDLRALINRSYESFSCDEVVPLVQVGGRYVMELFHGPTLSFKDIALQFLGNLFEYSLERSGGRLNIVAATSGDTGSAAIYGVRGKSRINIFVMHPHGRVSPSQEKQMTTVLDDNVFNLSVKGTFDDCQKILKGMLGDREFRARHDLGAVNSINWARIVAQIVYYFHGAFRVMDETGAESVQFAVPTGNFGDVLAGYFACCMGLPVERLILATNENDILARFFATGRYKRGQVYETLSPAMDIQVASNFERYLFYHLGCDGSKVSGLMKDFVETGSLSVDVGEDGVVDSTFAAGASNSDQTLETIKNVYEKEGYVMDPHTAVAVGVSRNAALEHVPLICIATAHPAKFSEAITRATGQGLGSHDAIDRLTDLPSRCKTFEPDEQGIRDYIEQTLLS